jgi:hypothetical protein
MVARHEMPGKQAETVRPVGNGVIPGARPYPSSKTLERPLQPDHTVPYGTGFSVPRFQAFHAWLPSFRPSGTRVRSYHAFAQSPFRPIALSPIRRLAQPLRLRIADTCPNKHNAHVAKIRRAFA